MVSERWYGVFLFFYNNCSTFSIEVESAHRGFELVTNWELIVMKGCRHSVGDVVAFKENMHIQHIWLQRAPAYIFIVPLNTYGFSLLRKHRYRTNEHI